MNNYLSIIVSDITVFMVISIIILLIIGILYTFRKQKVRLNQIRFTEKYLLQKIEELNIKRKELSEKVDPNLNSDGTSNIPLLTYSELSDLILNYKVTDLSGITYQLVKKSNTYLEFSTIMKDGYKFSNHYHDCIEEITVISGILACPNTDKLYKSGETIVFSSYQPHQPYSIGKTTLSVKFFKPNLYKL